MGRPLAPAGPSASLLGEAVAGQRGNHQVERVVGARAVGGGVRERLDDLELSMIEPGQPCVTISGSASSRFERTWMKWMSSPSISVMNCGRALSFASHARQSYSVAQ